MRQFLFIIFAICALPFYLLHSMIKFIFVRNRDGVTDHPDRAFAVYLAYPMAYEHSYNGLEPNNPKVYGNLFLKNMQTELKVKFDIPSSYNEEKIQAMFAKTARSNWYKWDVEQLKNTDNWRNGMAFACARTAFSLRVAFILGWLDEDTQWDLLLLNAQRAQACFTSWEDFATAWSKGRTDWLSRSRTDNLGIIFGDKEIAKWLDDEFHVWQKTKWDTALKTTSQAA